MLNFFIPFFYVRNVRYYQGKKIIAYILNELSPLLILVFSYSTASSPIDFALVLIGFWCFYEIGYFINDLYSAKNENDGKARNTTLTIERGTLLFAVVFRVLIFFILYLLMDETYSNYFVLFSGLTLLIFIVHNLINVRLYRFITLLALGYMRYMFVPLILGVDFFYLFIFFTPLIVVKILDYAYEKFNCTVDFRNENLFRILINIPFILVLCVFFPLLNLAYVPILLFPLLKLIIIKK